MPDTYKENIIQQGTRAHRQLKAYELAQAAGSDKQECLNAVVDTLVSDTAEGL